MSIKDRLISFQNLLNNYYIFLFGFFICLIGFNNYLNCLVIILILIMLLWLDFEKFLFFYIYLDIFSMIFNDNQIYTFILRIYQILFFIKIFIKIKQTKQLFSKYLFIKYCKMFWMIPILLISLILYERNILTIVSFILFHIPMLFLFCIKIRNETFKQHLFKFIALSGIIVMTWGLIHNTYGITYMGNSVMTNRMSYVSENPNISGYILLLSTISTFYFMPNRKYLFIALILTLGVLSTVSISAISILILFLLIYILINKYIKLRYVLLFFVIILICIFVIPFPIFVYIKSRILEIILPFISTKYAPSTSSGMERIEIYQAYIEHFFRLPLNNILFGGLDITKGYLLDYFIKTYNVLNSHCFIIDLLYGNGVVFISLFLIGVYNNLKKTLYQQRDYILFSLKISIILIACLTKVYPSILFYLLIVI